MAKKKNPAGGQLSTKLVYLDLNVILANYRNPKFWGKRWPIFESGDLKIYWTMTSINVRENLIYSEVHAESFVRKSGKLQNVWDDGKYAGYTCDGIPINNPDYKQETFKRNILSNALGLIRRVEQWFIMDYAEYKKADALDDSQEEILTTIATEIADEYIKNGGPYANAIREAFVEKYVSAHKTNYKQKILQRYDHKVLSSAYLGICSWFGCQNKFEEELKKVGDGEKEHLWIEMYQKAKSLQSEEWKHSMEKELRESFEEE